MRHSASAEQESTEATVGELLPAAAERLGIDAEGRIHYWVEAQRQMVIVETTQQLSVNVECVDVSPGAEFKGYVQHAADIAGWDSIQYSDGFLGLGGN
jgi:hypothetical protein